MNGRELYRQLLQRHPRLLVLYMSGYPGELISNHGVLDADVALIQKPFAGRELLEKLRETLDASARRRTPASLGGQNVPTTERL